MLPALERQQQTSAIAIAQNTEDMIRLWLHGKSQNTIKSYRRDIYELLTFVGGVELNQIKLNDLQGYEVALGELGKSPNTIARKLAAVKSLLTFCHKVGFVSFNVGSLVNIKASKDKLSERILSHAEIMDMVYSTKYTRDRLLLKLLYGTGARVGEICQLTWRDIKTNDNGGARITLFGKGNKTRVVLITESLLAELQQLKNEDHDPVFRSRKGGTALTTTQVYRIVKAAAKRVGITGNVSPHWLRHSHASHALDNNAPIHTVQKSLGHSSIATTERYLHSNPKDGSGLYVQV